MGWWDYKNIGASTSRLNKHLVARIFEYMGYCSRPDYAADGEDCSFSEPDVYFCMSSVNPYVDEQIRWVKALDGYDIKDLRDLLNALFPGTIMYIHSASGNNTSDTWENHDEVYNPHDMTCYGIDKYVDYGGGTYQPNRSWKARFDLKPPKLSFVEALISISADDENTELTTMLQKLAEKLKDKTIVYVDDPSDDRKVNKKYDIVEGAEARLQIGYRQPSAPQPASGDISCFDYCEQNKAWIDKYVSELTDLCSSTTIDNLINSRQNALEYSENAEILGAALKNIDTNAVITFEDKHFVFTGLAYHEEMFLEYQIEKRGGIYHPKMVNSCDYLIVSLSTPGSGKVSRALSLKDRGFGIQMITEYQLWNALCDKKFNVMSDEEAKALLERRKQEKKNEEAERLKKKQEQEEAKIKREAARQEQLAERRRIAQEAQEKREIERQQREEAKQKLAEETARIRQEKEKAKEERERQAIAAREQRELQRQEARANAVILYSPGNEPERIQKRIATLFEKLDGAYPDKRIQGLNKNHKKWGETVTELYRILGYADSVSFLEAYGYTVVQDGGGRKTSVDPVAIIKELHRRYPNGAGNVNMDYLKAENPDIPWKTLANNAQAYFGTTLSAYLKGISIIGGTEGSSSSAKKAVEEDKPEMEVVTEAPQVDMSPANTKAKPSKMVAEITSSEKRYLLAIQQLVTANTTVRAVDIASVLGYSSAAVSNALKKLKEKGLISVAANGAITLLQEENAHKSKSGTTELDERLDLTISELSYLNAIRALQNEKIKVRSVDVATILGVSRASVSIALKKLREKGLVMTDVDGSLRIVEPEVTSEAQNDTKTIEDNNRLERTLEEEDKAKREAEDKARHEAEEKARREAEEKARREAEEKARREAEETARHEAEEKARRETEERARREAEEKARHEAEEKARREAEEKARREAEEKARREAEEKARREAEEKAKGEAETKKMGGKYHWIGEIIPDGADQAEYEKELEEMSDEEAEAMIEALRKLKDLQSQLSEIGDMIDQAQKEEEEKTEREKREAQERAKQEAEENARREQARREREEAERRSAEARKKAERDRINEEIFDLTSEMNSLRGLFAGMKRKKLQKRIDELNEQLRKL